MNWLNIFESGLLPLDDWVQTGVDWMSANWRGFFQAIKVPVEVVLDGIETVLLAVPPTLMPAILGDNRDLPEQQQARNQQLRQQKRAKLSTVPEDTAAKGAP